MAPSIAAVLEEIWHGARASELEHSTVDFKTVRRSDLVNRRILVKTSKATRGPAVTYGPGERFPTQRNSRRPQAGGTNQGLLDLEDDSGQES